MDLGKRIFCVVMIIFGAIITIPCYAQITPVSPEEAAIVAGNWLQLGQELSWGWRGVQTPKAPDAKTLERDGEIMGYCFETGEEGYIVVPACRELPPITAYSTTSSLDVKNEDGFAGLLKDALSYKMNVVKSVLDPAAPAPQQSLRRDIDDYRRLWDAYLADYTTFTRVVEEHNRRMIPDGGRGRYALDDFGPLIATSWDQGNPYYNDCPAGDGGLCVVGCVATACAQVIAYWRYPVAGFGTHSYYWSGDNSCGGSTSGQTLAATYTDTYDWANILNHYTGSESAVQKAAVAELSYEAGVAVNMDYGHCSSGATTADVMGSLTSHFGYASDIDRENRSAYGSADDWFAMLQADLNLNRPLQYRINTHSIVCDGWRVSGSNQIHINYGWDDSHTTWYNVDGIYCPWDGCDPLVEYAIRRIHPSTTFTVTTPNGSEVWIVGSPDTIRWATANYSENVRLELNRTYPSATWTVIASNTENDGAYPWIPTTPVSGTARMRVSGVLHTFVSDTSNANFAISVRTITVQRPNGGETFVLYADEMVTWASQYVTGNVRIELNRNYPGGTWDTLAASVANTGSWMWNDIAGPATGIARLRIISISYPTISDVSDGVFTLRDPNQPPVLFHNPLGDVVLGGGTVTALATDDQYRSVATVKMFYRLVEGELFDSLALSPTVNPNEYAAGLGFLGEGSYEYYLRVTDGSGASTVCPVGAPATLYSFDVAALCEEEIGYDDGSAEWFNWGAGDAMTGAVWAVKFGPVDTPFVLCGARFAASCIWPDTVHSPMEVIVLDDDGLEGVPGTVIANVTTGSVGNVIGGLPAGTNWARAFFADESGDPLLIHSPEFYVAMSNIAATASEAFGRDTNSLNAHRSYYYDPCDEQWYSEDDTLASENTYPGNRLIRIQGYSLNAPAVVIRCNGGTIGLHWPNSGAPVYQVYAAEFVGGPYSLMHVTADTFLTVANVDTAALRRFYQVRAATE